MGRVARWEVGNKTRKGHQMDERYSGGRQRKGRRQEKQKERGNTERMRDKESREWGARRRRAGWRGKKDETGRQTLNPTKGRNRGGGRGQKRRVALASHRPSTLPYLQPLGQTTRTPSPALPVAGLGHRWANRPVPQLSLCKTGTTYWAL